MNPLKSVQNIALFTLGNVVAFPGHQLQFHIFEPRYRCLVKNSSESGIWVGVPLGRLLKTHRKGQSAKDFLSSNQENYEPASIFGAGPLEILRSLPDGRYEVAISVKARFESVAVVQQMPYPVVQAVQILDKTTGEAAAAVALDTLLEALHFLSKTFPLLQRQFNIQKQKLKEQSTASDQLSWLVWSALGWFQLPADVRQQLLEEQCAVMRSQLLLQVLAYLLAPSALPVGWESQKEGMSAAEGNPVAKVLSFPKR